MVTAVPIEVDGETQYIVSVMFGGEGTAERYEKSTMLVKYAQQYYEEKDLIKDEEVVTPPTVEEPADAEVVEVGAVTGTTTTVDTASSSSTPKTGDTENALAWIGIMLAAGVCAAGTSIVRRKEN
jgi:LPXTG-motif cell wall-anchored protein